MGAREFPSDGRPSPPQDDSLRGRAFRFLRFGVVGGSGVVVNQGLLMLLHGGLAWPLLASSVVAIEAAILNNFLWSSVWIWRYDYQRSGRHLLKKLAQYQLATLFSSMFLNAGVLAALVYGFGLDYRLANLVGIASGMAFNFLAGEFWVFRRGDDDATSELRSESTVEREDRGRDAR